jgi:predicted aspartyl protease
VTLRSRSGRYFDITALVDSGADVSMFSPSVARIMGIDLLRGKRKAFRGLGGTVDAYVHRVNLQIGGMRINARVAFPKVEIPNILGRLDLLRNSSILLRDEKEVSFEY